MEPQHETESTLLCGGERKSTRGRDLGRPSSWITTGVSDAEDRRFINEMSREPGLIVGGGKE
jgi:hypothetical protein